MPASRPCSSTCVLDLCLVEALNVAHPGYTPRLHLNGEGLTPEMLLFTVWDLTGPELET